MLMAPPTLPETSAVAGDTIRFAEIISALSFALDLTEDATDGHAVRCCLLGMRLADRAGLSAEDKRNLYYALLLKDVGCSSNSARLCEIIGGDERPIKAGIKLEDWTRPHKPSRSGLQLLWNHVLPEGNAFQRAARIGQIALSQHRNNEEMVALRCDRGASIVRKLGLGEAAADAVRYLDEHWNGTGYPEHRKRGQIPLLARICSVAQHLDVFASEHGTQRAMEVLRERSGGWFDPQLVRTVQALHAEGTLWEGAVRGGDGEETRRRVLAWAPREEDCLGPGEIDTICEAFADVVDTKSPFTFRHSMGVTDAANAIAERMGLSLERRQLVRRASLLHDLGKLGVSNAILDKPAKLTAAEWRVVQGHPGLTFQILNRVEAFQQVALVAGEHHERLDGTGYPNAKGARELSVEARIIGVADVYGALAETRPYRESLEVEQVVSMMEKEVPRRLDEACFEALKGVLFQGCGRA